MMENASSELPGMGVDIEDANYQMLDVGLDKISDAEKFTKLSRNTLYSLMDSGELPFVKIGACRRIPHRALIELIAKRMVHGQ
jgi:excisionase family DNA binding protein